MRNCERLQSYLDRRLSAEERESFERHLTDCDACAQAAAEWSSVEEHIPAWLSRTTHDDPQPMEIQRLEALAREQNARKTSWSPWQSVLAAGSAAVLLVVLIAYFYTPEAPLAPQRTDLVAQRPSAPPVPLYEATEHEALTTQIDQDTVAVLPSGRVRLTRHTAQETRVTLDKGSVACRVAPRAPGSSFSVQAGEFNVRVIGTEFLVTLGPGAQTALAVVVAEGVVQVVSGQEKWTVSAGNTFQFSSAERRGNLAAASSVELALLDRHLPSPAAEPTEAVAASETAQTTQPVERDRTRRKPRKADVKAVPRVSLSEARNWLASGRIADAQKAVEDHLAASPNDATAWNLHGDCQRKTRKWKAAVRSYDNAISHGGSQQASRARYMAAQVLQKNLKDHQRAVAYYEAYVTSGKETVVMIDVAKINQARSLIALGQKDRAARLLRAVIAAQGDSFVAANARHLLKKIE